jgi:hypothetical protein
MKETEQMKAYGVRPITRDTRSTAITDTSKQTAGNTKNEGTSSAAATEKKSVGAKVRGLVGLSSR